MNVFIAGGSSRTGLALAKYFLKKGDFLYTTYHNTKDNLEKLSSQYKNIKFVRCNFNSPEVVFKKNIESLEIESLDVILNVLGPYREVDIEKSIDSSDFEYMLKTNVLYVDSIIKMLYPKMIKNGGSIINFAYSNADKNSFSTQRTYYQIAKSAVLNLTGTFSEILGKFDINVNTISPGIQKYSVDVSGFSLSQIPQNRLGTFDDIINTVEFLINPKSRYVSGTNFIISGGYNVI